VKRVRFLGDSLKAVKAFPLESRKEAGFELKRVQAGFAPHDSKPMPAVGRGVEEIRLWGESGTFRVMYTAKIEDFVYVLHAFQKKTQQTTKRDLDLARRRFEQIGRIIP
jgi:phage-related protein